jgi:xylulokinase
MKYLLGIDFGGGASKATLIDENGGLIATATAEYPTLYPCMGACEQRPEDWLCALSSNVLGILDKSGIDKRDILAVAIDSATHTAVLCDGDKKPLRPAIHWTDSRSRLEAEALQKKCGDEILEKTFHKPDTIWTLPQLLFLKNNEPQLFARIRYIFFEKDYIRYFLTDHYCTDRIEAEGSMLFDCRSMQWDGSLCSLCGITVDMLPPLLDPTDVAGTVTEKAAVATGLAVGTPVICGTTDTALEIFASGAVEKGDMTVKHRDTPAATKPR